jgi:two-component system, NarL family, nitrate/nitrite response regulator NarL
MTGVPPNSHPGKATRVVLADQHSLFRASLRQLLSVAPLTIKEVYSVDVGTGFQVVGEAGTAEETVRIVESAAPDLLLFDPSMPRMSDLEVLGEVQGRHSQIRTVVLTDAIDTAQLLTAVQCGVRGLILKGSTTEVLFEAIVSVVAGQYFLERTLITHLIEAVRPLIDSSRAQGGKLAFGLTPREREVMTLVAEGCANKEIARQCAVSEATVKHHLTRIFDKVGVSNRTELAMLAAAKGLDTTIRRNVPIGGDPDAQSIVVRPSTTFG